MQTTKSTSPQTAGAMLPSIDDMNDIIRAAVEQRIPTTRGVSEDEADEHRMRHEVEFEALVEASTNFNPRLTKEQFLAGCLSWLNNAGHRMSAPTTPAVPTPVRRFDMVERTSGMHIWHEMKERPDGDYVTFEDFELATKARDAVFSQVVKSLSNHPAIASYERHCGERAVELAEGDLLGEALAALEMVVSHDEAGMELSSNTINAARAILAKAGRVQP